MTLSELHGFFTVLAISPETVVPSQWLPLVLADESVLESEEDEFINLIFMFYNSVCNIFHENPDRYKILVNKDKKEEDKTILSDWSLGVLEGISLHKDFWTELLNKEYYVPFSLLLGIQNKEIAEDFEVDFKISKQNVMENQQLFESYIKDIYYDILEYRKDVFDATNEIISKPKVGRNDPCPCGSGKKFKKCCMN